MLVVLYRRALVPASTTTAPARSGPIVAEGLVLSDVPQQRCCSDNSGAAATSSSTVPLPTPRPAHDSSVLTCYARRSRPGLVQRRATTRALPVRSDWTHAEHVEASGHGPARSRY